MIKAEWTNKDSLDLQPTCNQLATMGGDLISRADAMGAVQDHFNANGFKGYDDGQKMLDRINALPLAETHEIRTETHGVCSDLISRADAIEAVKHSTAYMHDDLYEAISIRIPSAETTGALDDAIAKYVADGLMELPSADAEKKKAELKENGDWDCPDVGCDECDHHRSVEWCSLAIPNHEEIDETYKMVNEAFFEGFDAAEKRYRFLIETVEELDKKLAEAEWIPCSERLPSEKDGRVLVTKRNEVMIARYSEFSGRWYLGDMCAVCGENPIAWMPLPKPYREDGEV